MEKSAHVSITLVVKNDLFYHLEQAAIALRTAMDVANHGDEYAREAELGDMLTHVLLALSNLPPKTDDFPF